MRVAHLSDLHLTEGPRGADTLKCLQWIVEDGEAQGVELWLVVGDLTGWSVPHESTMWERNQLDKLFQRMAGTAPVVIVCGNHDQADDIVGYGRLDGWNPILVATGPKVYDLVIRGRVNPERVETIRVGALPYPTRQVLNVCALSGVGESNDKDADAIRAKLLSWAALMPRATILAAHINIVGCESAGDEVMGGHETELWPEDLEKLNFDYIALGHIHKFQQMAPTAYYCGPPSAQSFGEQRIEPGYIIADVVHGEEPVIHRRFTPSRKLVTVTATWDGCSWLWEAVPFQDADVRVRVNLNEGDVHGPYEELERGLTNQGAHTVKIERHVTPKTRVRSEEIQQAKTDPQRLRAYWNTLDPAPTEDEQARALVLFDELVNRATVRATEGGANG